MWRICTLWLIGLASGALAAGEPQLRVNTGHDVLGGNIAWICGGSQLATTGRDGIRYWDPTTGDPLGVQFSRSSVVAPPLLTDLAGVVVVTQLGVGRYVALNAVTRQPLSVPTSDRVERPLACSADGRTLAAADAGQGLFLLDMASAQMTKLAAGPTEGHGDLGALARGASWSGDGQLLAVGFAHGVGVWQTGGGAPRALSMGDKPTLHVAWCDGGRLLAALAEDGIVWVWEAATWRLRHRLQFASPGWGTITMAADPAAPRIWVQTSGAVVEADMVSGARREFARSEGATCLAVDPARANLALLSCDATLHVYRLVDGKRLLRTAQARMPVLSVGWSQDGSLIGYGGAPAGWPSAHTVEKAFSLHDLSPTSVSSSGSWVLPVLATAAGRLRQTPDSLWHVVDRPDGQPEILVPTLALTFLPNGDLARAFGDGTVRQCRIGDLATVRTFSPSTSPCAGAASPDGRYLACAGRHDCDIIVWPLHTAASEVWPLIRFLPTVSGDWIAWTQEGYYACSPGAEDMVGWLVDRGDSELPDYFPAKQFRTQFYRPDIIRRVLDCGSVAEAVKQADAERKQTTDVTLVAARIEEFAPPKVEIVEPAEGAVVAKAEVQLRLRVKDPNGRKVVAMIPLVNGRPLSGGRFVFVPIREPGEYQATVPLSPGENVISAIAVNDAGSQSAPVSVAVRYEVAGAETQKPALYVLAVGVSAYGNKDYALRFAAKDAGDIAGALKQQEGRLFRRVEVKLLTDKGAAGAEVLDGLDWLTRQVTQRDYAVVFLAGHGVSDNAGEYYFLPADGDVERLRRTGLHWSQFRTALRAVPGKVLLAMDTCHSAGAAGTRALGARLDYTNVLRDAVSDEMGLVTLSSCMPSEVSFEQDDWGNGAFSKALVEALGGRADSNSDGVVTLAELDAYTSDRVKELTGGRQHATCQRPSTLRSVLPLAMVK